MFSLQESFMNKDFYLTGEMVAVDGKFINGAHCIEQGIHRDEVLTRASLQSFFSSQGKF
jgi:hypothetical protein